MRRHRLKALALCLLFGCDYQLRPHETCSTGDAEVLRAWVAECIANRPIPAMGSHVHRHDQCGPVGERLFHSCTNELIPSYRYFLGGWLPCNRLPKDHPTRIECESKDWGG